MRNPHATTASIAAVTALSLLSILTATADALAAPAPAQQTDAELRTGLRRVDRELATLRDLADELAGSERTSSNTARASVIDRLQEHMIAVVLERENDLGVEHTIIRHGQPVSGPTGAAEVGDPHANKETRRRIRRGTSDKSDAFLRLVRLQQQVMSGERIYRQAVERQPGAFASYSTYVREFGAALQEERDGLQAELDRRDAAAAGADTAAGG